MMDWEKQYNAKVTPNDEETHDLLDDVKTIKSGVKTPMSSKISQKENSLMQWKSNQVFKEKFKVMIGRKLAEHGLKK